MDWYTFKETHKNAFSQSYGFEELFVDNVLSKIKGLTPHDVIPQYHFTDGKGKNRYVDFMIINKSKSWLVPIELDGYAKMVGNGQEYHKFTDFLERQNAMIKEFGLVLRYPNKTVRDNPQIVIHEIMDTLQRQTAQKQTKDIQEKHQQDIIADYEKQIKRLKAKERKDSEAGQVNQEMLVMMRQMQNELTALKNVQATQSPVRSQPVYKVYEPEEEEQGVSVFKYGLFLIIGGGILFALVQLYYSQSVEPVTTEPPEPTKETYTLAAAPQQETQSQPKAQPKTQSRSQPKAQGSTYQAGQQANVCGVVYEAKEFKGGTYLNLNGYYPNHEITFTVWKQKGMDSYVGHTVCSYGKVEMYKGKPSININSLKGLKVQ